jgi:hypothetical protein
LRNCAGDDELGAVDVVWAGDVESELIDWQWEGYLAAGKTTMLSGFPEQGKSQILTDWAARISRGAHWPQGPRSKRGSCFILSSEDALEDTIRPRLEAAGADMEQVAVIKSVPIGNGKRRTFSLQDDLERLANMFNNLPPSRLPPALLGIDPVTAYLGGGAKLDTHRNSDVRAALQPLEDFAARYKVAVLSITHPPKGTTGTAINAYAGSGAFIAAARVGFIVAPEMDLDNKPTGRKLLLPVKCNIGPRGRARGYRIEAVTVSKMISAPRIVWDDAPVDISADQALYQQTQAAKGNNGATDANAFLREMLKDGPAPTKEIEEAAEAFGISERTLYRARAKLGVKARKDGYQGAWCSSSPKRPRHDAAQRVPSLPTLKRGSLWSPQQFKGILS